MRIYDNGIYRDMTQEETKEYNKNNIEMQQEHTLEEQILKLQEVNAIQDTLIDVSLLATDEIFMMIEPLLVQNYSIGGNSKMIDMYVAMVQRGLKTIDEVPLRYREEVRMILEQLEK